MFVSLCTCGPLKHLSPSLCLSNSLYQLGFLWLQGKQSQLKLALEKKSDVFIRIPESLMKHKNREVAAHILQVATKPEAWMLGSISSRALSLLLPLHVSVTDCCFSSTKRQKTKTVLKFHWVPCWKILGRDADWLRMLQVSMRGPKLCGLEMQSNRVLDSCSQHNHVDREGKIKE